MNKRDLILFLQEHYFDITNVSINGCYYNVLNLDEDLLWLDEEEFEDFDIENAIIFMYDTEDGMYMEYNLNLKEILSSKTVKFYERKEIEM